MTGYEVRAEPRMPRHERGARKRPWRRALLAVTAILTVSSIAAPAAFADPLAGAVGPQVVVKQADDLERMRAEMMRRLEEQLSRVRRELTADMERMMERLRRQQREQDPRLQRAQARIAELEAEVARLRALVEELRRDRDRPDDRDRVEVEPAPASGRPLLGVFMGPPSEEEAARVGSTPANSIKILEVMPDSPAQSIGLNPGDVITRVDGSPASMDRFMEVMADKRPGDRVSLSVARFDGGSVTRMEAQAKLANQDDFAAVIERMQQERAEEAAPAELAPRPPVVAPPPPAAPGAGEPIKLGARVREETDFRLIVVSVTAGGNAAEAGLREGDQILSVNGQKVRTLDGVKDGISKVTGGQEMTIGYRRGTGTYEVRIQAAGPGGTPRMLALKETVESAPTTQPERRPPPPPPPPPPPAPREPGFLGIAPEVSGNELRIVEVVPGTAADSMGLAVGDILLEVNGKAATSLDALRNILGGLHAGDSVHVMVRRDGTMISLQGTLGKRPDDSSAPQEPSPSAADSAAAPESAPSMPVVRKSGRAALGVLAYEEAREVYVERILADSAAGAAGVRARDRLRELDGELVTGFDSLESILKARSPGDRVRLTVDRDGESMTFEVVLAAAPVTEDPSSEEAVVARTEGEPAPVAVEASAQPYLGVTLEELMDQRRVYVVDVIAGSPADAAGLRVGDEILGFAGSTSGNLDDYRAALEGSAVGRTIEVRVRRGEEPLTLRVTVGRR